MDRKIRLRSARRELLVQSMVIAFAMVAMVAPPAEGTIAIIPVLPDDPAASWRWAVSADALLIAPGRYPGSIIVRGSFAKLLLPALAHGALLLSARYAGCGLNQIKERS
jgi:hypothetical protein